MMELDETDRDEFLKELETIRFTRRDFDQLTFIHSRTGQTMTRHRRPKISMRERIWMIEELQRRVYSRKTGRNFGRRYSP